MHRKSTPEALIRKLKDAPKRCDVFNPWWQRDQTNDASPDAPAVRRENLRRYLECRRDARLLILAEAVGYQGGHFTGTAMTSERMLLGLRADIGVLPEHIFPGAGGRTSREDLRSGGFNEPTATVVWGHALARGLAPTAFVLWNIYPWHPFHPAKGMLSNRTPDASELERGGAFLREFLSAFHFEHILAVGNKSFETLAELGIKTRRLRHPANGGAKRFRAEFDDFLHEAGSGLGIAPGRLPA